MKAYFFALLFLTVSVNYSFSQTIRFQSTLKGGLTAVTNSLLLTDNGEINNAGGTYMSSSSDLVLPSGSSIAKAILYVEGYTNQQLTSVKFSYPSSGGLQTLTTASPGFIANPINGNSTQFIIDVTNLIPSNGYVSNVTPGGSGFAGRYSVGDLAPFDAGNEGYGWTMMVVYTNANSHYRNITIADVCNTLVTPNEVTITGLQVPSSGSVNAIVITTGCYGDEGFLFPDYLQFGLAGSTLTNLSDPQDGTANNILNGTISFAVPNNLTDDGLTGMTNGNYLARNPYNGFGFFGNNTSCYYDCDVMNASGIIPPSSTPVDVSIRQSSGGADDLCVGAYGISIDVDPAILTLDVSPNQIPCGGAATYTFTIANTLASAYNLAGIGFTNLLPSGLIVANPNNANIYGGSGGTLSATSGGNTIGLSGFSLNAGQTATITVDVTNVSGQVNPTCSGNPAGFTNGFLNITSNTNNLSNSLTPQCLIVDAGATPTFGAIGPFCEGSTTATLPTTSTNGVVGTWSPALSTTTPGTSNYVFHPTNAGCADSITVSVTIDPSVTPTFNAVGPFCQGELAGLPTASSNGISGSWSPPFSTTTVGTQTYTFTPAAGSVCATTEVLNVLVDAPSTTQFNTIAPICVGTTPPSLTSTSLDGFTGTWAPSSINSAVAGTTYYTFTPTSGQCASSYTMSVDINDLNDPTFTQIPALCLGSNSPVLNSNSLNGIAGTWSPSTISTTTGGSFIYTFNPNAGQCAATLYMTIPVIGPESIGIEQIGPFCETDANVYTLNPEIPGGTWSGFGVIDPNLGTFSPAQATVGSNTITYTLNAGCTGGGTSTIVVNSMSDLSFTTQVIAGCSPVTVLFTANSGSDNSFWEFGDGTSVYSPGQATHTFSGSGCFTVTLTNTLDACVGTVSIPDVVCLLEEPVAAFVSDATQISILDPTVNFINQSSNATSYEWSFGDGFHDEQMNPSYTYVSSPSIYTVTLYAYNEYGCVDSTTQIIHVENELIVHIPNAFTPDGNEFNNVFQPVLFAGYDPRDYTMRIFDRWGEVLFETHDANVGWDGTYRGIVAQQGQYTWTMRVKSKETDDIYSYNGSVLLLK